MATMMQPPAVPRTSWVMLARDRTDLLLRCLHALLVQTLPPQAFEILVVDDARDRSTRLAVHAGRPQGRGRVRGLPRPGQLDIRADPSAISTVKDPA